MVDDSLLPPDPKRSKSFEGLSHAGHRERMRQRVLQKGASSLQDYELLEMLLFLVIPRKDTKPLAKQLIQHFGSLDAVFDADLTMLETVMASDSALQLLYFIRHLSQRLIEPDIYARPYLEKFSTIIDYLNQHAVVRKQDIHLIRILLLDGQKRLIIDEFISSSHDMIAIIIRKAIEFYATSVIIVRYVHQDHLTFDLKQQEAIFALLLQKKTQPFSLDVHDYIICYHNHYLSLFKPE